MVFPVQILGRPGRIVSLSRGRGRGFLVEFLHRSTQILLNFLTQMLLSLQFQLVVLFENNRLPVLFSSVPTKGLLFAFSQSSSFEIGKNLAQEIHYKSNVKSNRRQPDDEQIEPFCFNISPIYHFKGGIKMGSSQI